MRLDSVVDRVERIRASVGDDERAHSMEDALYTDLLRAIAAGLCEDPAACAKAALTTQTFGFARWYA